MKPKQTTLFCFSPPVMLATIIIELVGAIYVWTRYKANNAQRLAVAILLLLATFQLAEYNVCTGLGMSAVQWSKTGYVAISMLPALGLHLAHALAGKKAGRIVYFSYALAGVWSSLFLFGNNIFQGHSCGNNYVIFQMKAPIGDLYFVYYYLLLFLAMGLSLRWFKAVTSSAKRSLTMHTVGYSSFIIPTSVANLIYPSSTAGIPSIMCGFAVFYALMLTFTVLPQRSAVTVRARKQAKQ